MTVGFVFFGLASPFYLMIEDLWLSTPGAQRFDFGEERLL